MWQAGKAGNGALNALNYKLNAASAAPGHGLDFTNERLAVVARQGQWQEKSRGGGLWCDCLPAVAAAAASPKIVASGRGKAKAKTVDSR